MRVAVVSPLPPALSGVADYAARLNRELEREFEIVASEHADSNVLDSSGATLYHLGNNRLHAAAYRAAISHPGVVVLHDAVLHHFFLGQLDREGYIDEVVYNEGEWFRGRAAEFWQKSSASESDEHFFRHPMLRRVVEHSKAIIVHNPKARRMVEQVAGLHAPGLRIFEIPHFAESPPAPDPASRSEVRSRLGIEDQECVIACLGYLRPSKRIATMLDALRSLHIPYRLLLAGNFTSPAYQDAILRRADGIRLCRMPYLPEQGWWKLVAATDVCVNLRHPSAGETSGILIRMMAMGKPVLVTSGEEVANLPSHAVIRVDHGEAEADMLTEYLRALASNPDLRMSVGLAARDHVKTHHGIGLVASQYAQAIRQHFRHDAANPTSY